MKLNPSIHPDKVGYHRKVFSSESSDLFRLKTDLVEKSTSKEVLFSGGDEESRTPVQKFIHTGFYECILWSNPHYKVHKKTIVTRLLNYSWYAQSIAYSRSPLIDALSCAVVLTGKTTALTRQQLIRY